MNKGIYSFLFCMICVLGVFAQNRKIDSLQTALKTAISDTARASIYIALTEEWAVSKIDTVIPLCKKALQIIEIDFDKADKAEKKSFLKTKAQALNNIGYINLEKGSVTEALDWFQKSLKIQEEIGDKMGMAASLSNIGFIYNNQGNISKALDWFQKSLKIQEEIGDKHGIAALLLNIGFIYSNQGDNSKSLEWYQKSLKICEEIGNKRGIASSLTNIADIYNKMGDAAKALEGFQKGLKIYEEIGDKQGVASLFNNIGVIYSLRGDNPMALEWLQEGLKIFITLNDKHGEAVSYNSISRTYLLLNNYKEAEKYSKLSLKTARELGFPENIRDAGDILSNIYTAMGKEAYDSGNMAVSALRYRDAREMHVLFKLMADSINNVETRKSALKKQLQYDFEKKEDEAKADQDKKDAVAMEEIQRQKIVLNSFIFGFALVLILGIVVFRGYRQKRKANLSLEDKNKIIEEKNKEITDSIHYAKQIQHALLAGDSFLKKHLPEYFILYKPKDIVSGDFYWAATIDDKLIMITADCTGHGVPGAFMSLLNISYLREAVIEKKIISPEKILDYVRTQLIHSLNPEGSEIESKDGMDAVLSVIDFKQLKLDFACANNPLWILRGNKLIEFKPDKMPVGMHYGEQKPFSLNSVDLQKGDVIYTFTDGYADQFGGNAMSKGHSDVTTDEQGKKFKYKQLKELLIANADKSMDAQKEILNKTFETWKGSLEQIDDVLIIGIRV